MFYSKYPPESRRSKMLGYTKLWLATLPDSVRIFQIKRKPMFHGTYLRKISTWYQNATVLRTIWERLYCPIAPLVKPFPGARISPSVRQFAPEPMTACSDKPHWVCLPPIFRCLLQESHRFLIHFVPVGGNNTNIRSSVYKHGNPSHQR